MRSIFWPNPVLSTHPVAEVRDSRKRSRHSPGVFRYFSGSVTPGSLTIKEKAGDPEASVSMHNLKRIDASRGWPGIVLRIPAFFCAPNLDKIAKLLDADRDAALEETVRLEVRIVSLHEHAWSQDDCITLLCRFILCGRRLRIN